VVRQPQRDVPTVGVVATRTDPIDEAVRLHTLAVAAWERHRFENAERLATGSLRRFESVTGPVHPDVANVLLCLAGVHRDRGNYEAALRLFRRALRILRTLPEDRRDLDVQRLRMQAIGGLGTMYRTL